MDKMESMNPKKFKRILVGVDDSPDAQLAFRYAMNRAKYDEAELVICSIMESDNMNIYQALSKDYVHGQRAELVKHLEQYQNLAERVGVKKVKLIIGEGDPGETMVKTIIPEVKPDILVIGSLSKSGVRKYFGSQAAYMAKYSPVSDCAVTFSRPFHNKIENYIQLNACMSKKSFIQWVLCVVIELALLFNSSESGIGKERKICSS